MEHMFLTVGVAASQISSHAEFDMRSASLHASHLAAVAASRLVVCQSSTSRPQAILVPLARQDTNATRRLHLWGLNSDWVMLGQAVTGGSQVARSAGTAPEGMPAGATTLQQVRLCRSAE